MPYLILGLLLILAIFGPQYWVRYVMAHYNRHPEKNFSGTGGELARHLLDRFDLGAVGVEVTDGGDHYDPGDRCVRLTRDKYEGRTLTAIAVAAHEVGHALQHARNESMFCWRTRLAGWAMHGERVGSLLLFAAPILAAFTRAPAVGLLSLVAAFLVIGLGVVVQLVTLPVELDASFKKALPILEAGYLDPGQVRGARRLLRAAALTYVAGSLTGLLNFWRWMRVLRR
jgi:Zn-dependent membrane protease YugP